MNTKEYEIGFSQDGKKITAMVSENLDDHLENRSAQNLGKWTWRVTLLLNTTQEEVYIFYRTKSRKEPVYWFKHEDSKMNQKAKKIAAILGGTGINTSKKKLQ